MHLVKTLQFLITKLTIVASKICFNTAKHINLFIISLIKKMISRHVVSLIGFIYPSQIKK